MHPFYFVHFMHLVVDFVRRKLQIIFRFLTCRMANIRNSFCDMQFMILLIGESNSLFCNGFI